jgi:hypothetical protein
MKEFNIGDIIKHPDYNYTFTIIDKKMLNDRGEHFIRYTTNREIVFNSNTFDEVTLFFYHCKIDIQENRKQKLLQLKLKLLGPQNPTKYQ